MSIFQTSSIGNFTRGGQTAIHFLRMIGQVISKFMALGILTLLLSIGGIFWYSTTSYERYVTVKYAVGYVVVNGLKRTEGKMPLELQTGQKIEVRTVAFLHNAGVQQAVNNVYKAAIWSLVGGILLGLFVLFLVFKFIYRFGSGQAEDEHVRGSQLVDGKQLKQAVKKFGKIPEMTIAGVPMPEGSDIAHTMLSGSSGTGKSTVSKEMLTGIRRRKQRLVIYDNWGEYVSHFYRPGKDIILNPLDERSAGWDVWAECSRDYEYDRMAESLIPERSQVGDPYWVLGARIVFAALAKKIASDNEPSNEKLMHAIMNVSIAEITQYVENTEAAAIISHGGERMAVSVRGVLAAYTRSMKYLPKDAPRFSIKDWIRQDDGDGWVFLTTKDEQRTALKPLITAWMDTAIAAIASLEPSRERRVWIGIDELPSLQKLPSLFDGLAGLRKFGGCFILGVQAYSQLVMIYGKEGADTIASGCSTWCGFRYNDKAGATYSSENLGNSETVETFEGISFGASEIRDGVTLSKQRNIRPIVLPTEIMNLKDLHGFVKFGRGLPVGRIVAKYKKYPKVADGFVDNGFDIVAPDLANSPVLVDGFPRQAKHRSKVEEKDDFVGNGLNGTAVPPAATDSTSQKNGRDNGQDVYQTELL